MTQYLLQLDREYDNGTMRSAIGKAFPKEKNFSIQKLISMRVAIPKNFGKKKRGLNEIAVSDIEGI